MEKIVAIGNIEKVARQRNLFLMLTILLSLTSVGLSVKLLTSDEKIILVPNLNQEVWTSETTVSKGYLEETSLMYLGLLLDLNHEIIDYKASLVFKYISQSSPTYMKNIQNYFADSKEKYKKFTLSTYFSIKSLRVDSKNLQVIADGILTSRFGDKGFEVTPASYLLSYEWAGRQLRLKEFVKVKEDKETKTNKGLKNSLGQDKIKGGGKDNAND